jgi:hypothetical protein
MPENWECLNLLPSLDIERFIEVLIVDGSWEQHKMFDIQRR